MHGSSPPASIPHAGFVWTEGNAAQRATRLQGHRTPAAFPDLTLRGRSPGLQAECGMRRIPRTAFPRRRPDGDLATQWPGLALARASGLEAHERAHKMGRVELAYRCGGSSGIGPDLFNPETRT
jgi:hypothetical protein